MTTTKTTETLGLPTADELRTRVRDALHAIGPHPDLNKPGAARLARQHPDNRRCAVHRPGEHTRTGRHRHRRSGAGLYDVAHHAGAGARCAGGAARRTARRAQGRSGDAGDRGGGEDHLRGTRRGAGDDRHLPIRGRSVASALRAHDRLRAAGAPADGDLAPARCGRRDHGVQLPGRGVVVEHRRRAGVRRHRGVEALGADAADRAGVPGTDRAGRRRCGRTAGGEQAGPGWP